MARGCLAAVISLLYNKCMQPTRMPAVPFQQLVKTGSCSVYVQQILTPLPSAHQQAASDSTCSAGAGQADGGQDHHCGGELQ